MVSMITGNLPWASISTAKNEDLDQLIKLRNPKTLCYGLPSKLRLIA